MSLKLVFIMDDIYSNCAMEHLPTLILVRLANLLMTVGFNSFNGIRNMGVQAMAIMWKNIVIFSESFPYYFATS